MSGVIYTLLSCAFSFTAGSCLVKKRSSNLFDILLGGFLIHITIILNAYYISHLLLSTTNVHLNNLLILVISVFIIYIKREAFQALIKEIKPLLGYKLHLNFPTILFLLGVVVLLSTIFYGLTLPALAEDDLQYHLIIPAEWLQAGHITFSKVFYSSLHGSYSPFVVELYSFHFLNSLGSDYLSSIIQAPLLIFVFVCMISILKQLNKDNVNTFTILGLTSLIFYQKYYILKQAIAGGGELGFFLFFMCALLYYLKKDLLMLSLSIGLFLGTKHIAVPYSILLLLLYFVLVIDKKEKFIKSILILIGGMLVTSAFWYLRNWYHTQNPFFPVDINLFGFNIFRGILQTKTDFDSLSEIFRSINIWGGIELVFYIFSIVMLFRKKLIPSKFLLILIYPFIIGLMFFMLPVHSVLEHRFLLPALGIIDIFIIYYALSNRIFRIILYLIQLAIMWPQWFQAITYYTGFDLNFNGLSIFLMLLLTITVVGSIAFRKHGITIAALLAVFLLTIFLRQYKYDEAILKRYKDLGESWLVGRKYCSNIAITGRNLNYHLMGRRFENKVSYVNPTIYDGEYLHEISLDAISRGETRNTETASYYYRNNFSYKRWEERLENSKVDCIRFIKYPLYELTGTGTNKTIEEKWIEDTNGLNNKFKRIFTKPEVSIWKKVIS